MIITSDSSSIIVGCQPFIVNNDHCRNAVFPFFNNFFIYKNLIQFNIFPRKKNVFIHYNLKYIQCSNNKSTQISAFIKFLLKVFVLNLFKLERKFDYLE